MRLVLAAVVLILGFWVIDAFAFQGHYTNEALAYAGDQGKQFIADAWSFMNMSGL